ncbi:hypothetical protein ACWGNN_44880 [Streptomyces sp. NPDC055817]|uniref:hypothetical protein n=1 Tax=Streptomyces sp. NPDC056975 TaxID=3345985 RepID=UPI003630D2CD
MVMTPAEIHQALIEASTARAQQALEAGQRLLVLKLYTDGDGSDKLWARQIEAAEDLGWKLEHFPVDHHGNRDWAYPVFRRTH